MMGLRLPPSPHDRWLMCVFGGTVPVVVKNGSALRIFGFDAGTCARRCAAAAAFSDRARSIFTPLALLLPVCLPIYLSCVWGHLVDTVVLFLIHC